MKFHQVRTMLWNFSQIMEWFYMGVYQHFTRKSKYRMKNATLLRIQCRLICIKGHTYQNCETFVNGKNGILTTNVEHTQLKQKLRTVQKQISIIKFISKEQHQPRAKKSLFNASLRVCYLFCRMILYLLPTNHYEHFSLSNCFFFLCFIGMINAPRV